MRRAGTRVPALLLCAVRGHHVRVNPTPEVAPAPTPSARPRAAHTSDPVDARVDAWLARLAELRDAFRDACAAESPGVAADRVDARQRALRRALRLVRRRFAAPATLLLECEAALAEATDPADPHAAACRALAGEILAAAPLDAPPRRDFYVYEHRDANGQAFYVGKGTGRRAWSRDRTREWRRYVSERLRDEYVVAIVADELTHEAAIAIEAATIAAHGPRLVNWINPQREFDADSVARAALLRTETLAFVGATSFFEVSAPAEAVRRYARALDDVRVYSRVAIERGLLGELKDVDRVGEPIVVDRLTRLLERLGRAAEVVDVAERYFADFPDAQRTRAGERVARRAARARERRLQFAGVRGRDGAPGRTRTGTALRPADFLTSTAFAAAPGVQDPGVRGLECATTVAARDRLL